MWPKGKQGEQKLKKGSSRFFTTTFFTTATPAAKRRFSGSVTFPPLTSHDPGSSSNVEDGRLVFSATDDGGVKKCVREAEIGFSAPACSASFPSPSPPYQPKLFSPSNLAQTAQTFSRPSRTRCSAPVGLVGGCQLNVGRGAHHPSKFLRGCHSRAILHLEGKVVMVVARALQNLET